MTKRERQQRLARERASRHAARRQTFTPDEEARLAELLGDETGDPQMTEVADDYSEPSVNIEPARYAQGIAPLNTGAVPSGTLREGEQFRLHADGILEEPVEVTWEGVTPEGEAVKVIDTGEGPPDQPGSEEEWDKFFAGTPASLQPEPEIPDTRTIQERLRPVPGRLWDKFLVQRRDGSVPHWPYLVIGARDPAAPAALRAYADTAASLGMNEEYCADIWRLADSFDEYRRVYGNSDPDADPHRADKPEVTARFRAGSTPEGWKLRRFDDVPDTDPWPQDTPDDPPFP